MMALASVVGDISFAWDSGFRVEGDEFGVYGAGCGVQGVGCGV